MIQNIRLITGKLLGVLPDKPYVYLFHYRHTGELLRLKQPLRFSHKIQWLKLYGRLERFAPYADKLTVRDYVERTVGAEYLVPLYGVWDRCEDIPFETLPDRFVLKVTKGCGYNYICKDKTQVDYEALKTTLRGWLSEDFYKQEREPQYRGDRARIICEAYLEDDAGKLPDYKFYCSKGIPKVIQVDIDRFAGHKSGLLDLDWKPLSYLSEVTFGELGPELKKPTNLPEMLDVAAKLSKNFPFVRVDLYSVGEKVYFGELTFTPGSGIVNFKPVSGDIEIGKLIDLEAYKLPLATV